MNISPNTKPVQTAHVCWICVVVWLGAMPLGATLMLWGIASLF